MSLEFKDILKWTPSTISIVDEPYHPLAYFEVYENDEEFVKKYREIAEVKTMSDEQNKGVTMSEGFFEKLLGGLVAKSNPEPQPNPNPEPQGDDEEVTNAEILEALNKFDERLTAIENSNKVFFHLYMLKYRNPHFELVLSVDYGIRPYYRIQSILLDNKPRCLLFLLIPILRNLAR